MDYNELAERLKCPQIRECPIKGKQPSCGKCQKDISKQAANAITDLLSRAEAAEARCKILETRLETAEKMVKEYQDTIVPGYRDRAEKAEREAKESQREAKICRDGWKKAESERNAYKEMIYKERPCAFCAGCTEEWNPECLKCDRSTNEYRPKFRLRELKEE